MNYDLRCHYCGRFVRYESIKTGDVDSKDIWDNYPFPSVDHVRYWHVACKRKDSPNDPA